MTYFRPQIGAAVTQTSIFKLDQNQTSLNKTQNTPATTTFYLSEHTNSLFLSQSCEDPELICPPQSPAVPLPQFNPSSLCTSPGSSTHCPLREKAESSSPGAGGPRQHRLPPSGPAGAADLGRLQIGQRTEGGGPGREPRGTKVAGQALSRGCRQKCQGPGGRTLTRAPYGAAPRPRRQRSSLRCLLAEQKDHRGAAGLPWSSVCLLLRRS